MTTVLRDSLRSARSFDSGQPVRGELRSALDELLTGGAKRPRIADLETRPLPYASSFAIEEVDVRFDDGSSLELVWKDTGEAAMLPEARRIRPAFLYDPRREIATYEFVLAPCGVSAPRLYGRVIDRRRGRYWLFLERVHGSPLTEVGDFDVWRHVSGWLARMHCRVAGDPALTRAAASVPLVRDDRALLWIERARWMTDQASEPLSRRRRFASLASRYGAVVEEIATQPRGFVHGEFFAPNVLVESGDGTVRVRPVDWELAGIGPPLVDLAALTAGRWTHEQRIALAMSYHAALDPHSDLWLPHEAFMRALDCCRLQLAVQRIGWAERWTPPAAQTHDWLGEALNAAASLGV
jgi:aminoglycoside phosphotransferase (APT) family kinase protein